MRRLRIEVLIPEHAVEHASTRVHQLMTREGWVLRHVGIEEIDWIEGLGILRDTLMPDEKDEIKNSFSPVVGEDESVTS